MDDGETVSQSEKGARFVALHAGPDLLILPNAWDVGSALLLQRAGFAAIATTSAGIGYSLGYPVGEAMPRDEMLRAVERMASRLSVPLSADMEAGFGADPEAIAETVRLTIQAGAVGINIEDSTYREGQLVEQGLATDCIQAAREAADATGIPFVLNARTDVYWSKRTGPEAFDETIGRAQAYRAAGADCLFIPGVEDKALISEILAAIDAPLNLMAGSQIPSLPILAEMGVRRVSLGAGIARAAYGVIDDIVAEVQGPGTFAFWDNIASHAELNTLLKK